VCQHYPLHDGAEIFKSSFQQFLLPQEQRRQIWLGEPQGLDFSAPKASTTQETIAHENVLNHLCII